MMGKSTILESLKICRDYVNGDDSHVEVINVPLPAKVEFNEKAGEKSNLSSHQ